MDPGAGHPGLAQRWYLRCKFSGVAAGSVVPWDLVLPLGGRCSGQAGLPEALKWPCQALAGTVAFSLRCSGHLAPHLQKRDECREGKPAVLPAPQPPPALPGLNLGAPLSQTRTRGQRGPPQRTVRGQTAWTGSAASMSPARCHSNPGTLSITVHGSQSNKRTSTTAREGNFWKLSEAIGHVTRTNKDHPAARAHPHPDLGRLQSNLCLGLRKVFLNPPQDRRLTGSIDKRS